MKSSHIVCAALAAAAVHAAPRAASMAKPVKRDSPMTGSQVGVFWGQSTEELSDVCSSGSYDIVFLAFATALNPPALNLGKNTGRASSAQLGQSGWDLFDGTVAGDSGTSVADQIKSCQSSGIKVMISFGGTAGISNAEFSSSDDAATAANNLWNLYLGGTDISDLRPFGSDVTLDGVDLDNETGNGANYDTFLEAVRKYMDGDSSHTYYISADPEAHTVADGDSTSIPQSVFQYIDFMNIQFYNDDNNEVGASNFSNSIKAWDSLLSSISPSPKLVVGMPGGDGAADFSQTADQISSTVSEVQGYGLANFGGFSIWDAGHAASNTGFSAALKSALSG